jgi:hypothetical protein
MYSSEFVYVMNAAAKIGDLALLVLSRARERARVQEGVSRRTDQPGGGVAHQYGRMYAVACVQHGYNI